VFIIEKIYSIKKMSILGLRVFNGDGEPGGIARGFAA
jgi:hypothetical protein